MTVGDASVRERILAALAEVLYIEESDLIDGDATDLKDLGLDSVRFALLSKRFGLSRGSELECLLAENLSVAGWIRLLENVCVRV